VAVSLAAATGALLLAGSRGTDIANVLAFPVGVVSLLLGLLTLVSPSRGAASEP
jgi:hypothetical protein